MQRGNLNFKELKTVVFDEADQMLKLGFKEDVERVNTTKNFKIQSLTLIFIDY